MHPEDSESLRVAQSVVHYKNRKSNCDTDSYRDSDSYSDSDSDSNSDRDGDTSGDSDSSSDTHKGAPLTRFLVSSGKELNSFFPDTRLLYRGGRNTPEEVRQQYTQGRATHQIPGSHFQQGNELLPFPDARAVAQARQQHTRGAAATHTKGRHSPDSCVSSGQRNELASSRTRDRCTGAACWQAESDESAGSWASHQRLELLECKVRLGPTVSQRKSPMVARENE